MFDVELADERVVGGGGGLGGADDVFLGRAGAELALHVGLAAAEPDFADEDVGDLDFLAGVGAFAGGGDEGARGGVGGERIEVHAPAADGVGAGGFLLVGEADEHFAAGGGGAPDRDGAAALEDHVVGEGAAELQRRVGGEDEEQRRDRRESREQGADGMHGGEGGGERVSRKSVSCRGRGTEGGACSPTDRPRPKEARAKQESPKGGRGQGGATARLEGG